MTETQIKRADEEYFYSHFPYLSVVLYTTIVKNVNLKNILIKITENKVDWNICRGKTRAKYSRFRHDGKTGEMTSSTRRGRQRDDSRVLVRMPGRVYLLPVAVVAPLVRAGPGCSKVV